MKFLNDMLDTLSEGSDLSELPFDVMSEVQNSIRKGAKDNDQKWSNALHLVQVSYREAGVERPDPSMKAGWKQYEKNIEYAVQQLSKFRGIDGDWRMSAAMFHEALEDQISFKVSVTKQDSTVSYNTEATSMDDIVNTISKMISGDSDIKITPSQDNKECLITFSTWGIKLDQQIKITQEKTI